MEKRLKVQNLKKFARDLKICLDFDLWHLCKFKVTVSKIVQLLHLDKYLIYYIF